jgi:glycosyltransferase involved in cell wall biosynthesis
MVIGCIIQIKINGMENRQPLLSICIPTYNRAEYLVGALENITSDPAFDERVEIVISDNASTDDTKDVVGYFIKSYSNIYYYKNLENIRDQNFILALSRGRGKYLRLFNDTLRLKHGVLQTMLDIIIKTPETESIFFMQNIHFNGNIERVCEIKGTNELLSEVSYYITWIANFGCWNSEISKINNPNNYAPLQLTQVDWFLQITETSFTVKIYFGDYFNSILPKHKGGYNIFEVFVNNYLRILRTHKISLFQYEIEKYRLLRYFIMPWWINIRRNKDLTFKINSKWKILFRHYILSPYFYCFILYVFFKRS